MNHRIALVPGFALAALVSGCVVRSEAEQPGTLEALWTVDDTTDPGACSYYARDPGVGMDFELLIYDGRGLLRDVRADCRDFGLSIDLVRGLYQGQATMVDPVTNEPLSTTLTLPNIRVHEDVTTTLDIDFPPSAFFYPVNAP